MYIDNPSDDDNPVTKRTKLMLKITNNEVNIGTYIKGGSYRIEPPENEIEFELDGIKAKKFTISINIDGSDNGNSNDVSIITEWRYSTDTGINDQLLISGSSYFFWNKMIIGCFITSINVPNNLNVNTQSFEQVISINFMF
jgi:hypothetical protein